MDCFTFRTCLPLEYEYPVYHSFSAIFAKRNNFAVNQYFLHKLSPVTDSCSSWISWRRNEVCAHDWTGYWFQAFWVFYMAWQRKSNPFCSTSHRWDKIGRVASPVKVYPFTLFYHKICRVGCVGGSVHSFRTGKCGDGMCGGECPKFQGGGVWLRLHLNYPPLHQNQELIIFLRETICSWPKPIPSHIICG